MVLSSNIDPQRIVFEGHSFAIYDIRDLLPRHANWPHGTKKIDPNTKKPYLRMGYELIQKRKLVYLIFHQTAGGYDAAHKQIVDTASFFIREPAWKPNPRFDPSLPVSKKNQPFVWTGTGRGWPGFAYTWFVPFAPIVWTNADGRELWIVYWCNDLDLVTFHTGSGRNVDGCGVAFQGYFLEETAGITQPMKGTDGEPSEAQLTIAKEFWLGYAVPVLGMKKLSGHWEWGKPSCPGRTLRELAIQLRGGK